MCFSATASFLTGSGLVVLGAATLRIASGRSLRPFAAIPLLFGVQQIVEGLVWTSLDHPGSLPAGPPALLYSLFAHVLWPVYVPWAVRAMEPEAWRRRGLLITQAVGLMVGAYFLCALAQSPPTARVEGAHLLYDFAHLQVLGGVALYLIATCASSLLSSHRGVRIFGILSLASFALTSALSLAALVSVWCFFAALLSTAVYVIVRAQRKVTIPVSATA